VQRRHPKRFFLAELIVGFSKGVGNELLVVSSQATPDPLCAFSDAAVFGSLMISVSRSSNLVANSASAATPASGTLTNATTTLTYSAGPFFVANPSNNVNSNGEPTCTPTQAFPCDDYTLTITVAPGTNLTKRVRVKVAWDVSSADFDLYVYQGATFVTSSAS